MRTGDVCRAYDRGSDVYTEPAQGTISFCGCYAERDYGRPMPPEPFTIGLRDPSLFSGQWFFVFLPYKQTGIDHYEVAEFGDGREAPAGPVGLDPRREPVSCEGSEYGRHDRCTCHRYSRQCACRESTPQADPKATNWQLGLLPYLAIIGIVGFGLPAHPPHLSKILFRSKKMSSLMRGHFFARDPAQNLSRNYLRPRFPRFQQNQGTTTRCSGHYSEEEQRWYC